LADNIQEKPVEERLTKEEIKKLELIKNLTPKQIQDILHHNTIATKTDKITLDTENI